MAVSKKKAEEKKAAFKEFKYTGKTFEYTGRIYAGKDGSGKIKRSWGLSLCLNGLFDLKGCKLVETESNVFITYPQFYTESKKEWTSYVYIHKELNDEIDGLVNELMRIVGIVDDDIAKSTGSGDENLPF